MLADLLRWLLGCGLAVALLAVTALGKEQSDTEGSGLRPEAVGGALRGTTLTIGLLANYAPYQVWPDSAKPGGMDVELLQQLADRTGARLGYLRFESFVELLATAKAGRVQLLTSMASTFERQSMFSFTRPYAVQDQVMVSVTTLTSLPNVPTLGGRRLALMAAHASAAVATERFPMAKTSLHASAAEAVAAVLDGKADLVFGGAPQMRTYLERYPQLRVARRYSLPIGKLHLAAPRDQQAVIDKLDQALADFDPAALRALTQRWVADDIV